MIRGDAFAFLKARMLEKGTYSYIYPHLVFRLLARASQYTSTRIAAPSNGAVGCRSRTHAVFSGSSVLACAQSWTTMGPSASAAPELFRLVTRMDERQNGHNDTDEEEKAVTQMIDAA